MSNTECKSCRRMCLPWMESRGLCNECELRGVPALLAKIERLEAQLARWQCPKCEGRLPHRRGSDPVCECTIDIQGHMERGAIADAVLKEPTP